MRVALVVLALAAASAQFELNEGKEQKGKDQKIKNMKRKLVRYFDENKSEHWRRDAIWTLKTKLEQQENTFKAKNIIMFLGDGMSVATLAATRSYMGRELGLMGEEMKLSFEEFPYTGLSKTYCLDRQVADSACSATAYLCGAKANYGTIGLTGKARKGDCAAQRNVRNHVDSIVAWAQDAGKKTGIVTTTRVTHASPAGTYAHAAERAWEADTDVVKLGGQNCTDITRQLVEGQVGKRLNVVMGGGRKNFYPKTSKDPEGFFGYRSDGKDLVAEWMTVRVNHTPAYVYNKKGLMEVDVTKHENLLGLFEPDHMKYNLDATGEDPTLREMTIKAIQLLDHNNPEGYFLFVEGGRIDMAHHETKARKALDETAQFSDAVEAAVRLVDLNHTLLVVTSDHSHTMTISGYNKRGSNVLGLSQMVARDGLPYTVLSYANGPGYRDNDLYNKRYNILTADTENADFMYPAGVPMVTETHGGEDVAVFAVGPWAHLFTGNYEQSFLPHAMAYAACIGKDVTACDLYDL